MRHRPLMNVHRFDASILLLGLACQGLAASARPGNEAAGQTAPSARASRVQGPRYLDTGGRRRLDVPYKQVAGKDLRLDLYYPTANRTAQCPVLVFTHGGGWAAGSRYKAAAGSFAQVFQHFIKNAGHNWRRVDADIEPSREVIIERSVQFFVDYFQ